MLDIPEAISYKIDEYGNVFSFKRYEEGKKLSPYTDKDGYLCVSLRIKNTAKAFKVHRLVALTYLKNDYNFPQVNHKDANKINNHVSNLEWCSNIKNQQHAWDLDLKTVKLKISDVIKIKKLLSIKNNTEISKIFKVDPSTISNIRTGKTWKRIVVDKDRVM